MKFERVFSRASSQTFTIPPIRRLLEQYVGEGKGWADPFAGANSPAEWTNDADEDKPTSFHLEAVEFCRILDRLDGMLIDPPYSYRQITEHYRGRGIKATYKDTSYNFYGRVFTELAPKVVLGGLAIVCGWNSNGVGKVRGFELIDGLVVAHGLHHNDTIITVEQKVRGQSGDRT